MLLGCTHTSTPLSWSSLSAKMAAMTSRGAEQSRVESCDASHNRAAQSCAAAELLTWLMADG